jgi:outer membrane protein OmpA-like peptidoglycan-associated protein
MAKEMAMQQHNTENSGKIMDQIKTAKSSGDITKQDAGQLVKDHLQQQIDGGGAKKAELDKAIRESLPSVAQAGVNAINRGRGDIATTISHPDGFVESVTVKNATAADQISGPLPVDMAAELDWARLHPVPETAEADMVLSLWNYPVGESELALEHRSAIDQFLKQAIQAATLGGSAVPSKVEIYITGHASKSGDNAANETVSRRRAENVASYLEYRGILRQQMRVDWAGSKEPADPGSSGFSAARNRRVDVYQFVPSEAETKQPPAEGPGSDVEVPVSPSSDESKSIESILNHIDEGAKVFEVVTTLAQMGGELAALEAAAGLVGLFGNVALLAWTVIQIADARNEGLLHDATMGWAYGITWAIDDASAIRASRPRPPVPTGATYRRDNPGFSSDAWEERQQAFEATVEAGIDLVIQSGASLFDERHDLYKGLILKLAILITKLGDKEGHKEFVTQIFRATYSKHDTVDHFHRENWWLDWPTMQAGMLKF